MIRAVSLDFTNTIAGIPRLGEIYREVLHRHGIVAEARELEEAITTAWSETSCRVSLGEDRFSAHPGGPTAFWRDFVTRVCALAGLPAPSPFAARELYDRFARPESWKLFAEVLPILETLAGRGITMGIVSTFDDRLPGLVEGLGLGAVVSATVYSSGVGAEKPHPAIFEQLLHELQIPPSEVVHIGDDRRDDVEGALAVGMEALLLDRKGGSGDLRDLSSLPDLLPHLGPFARFAEHS